ncbi:MAG: hypothetical protein EA426_10710 [Spirochaetaceae bacterium]|nr:MAG: hypothetical protein EA426_10710 [Spirochaetaceae bacterium]
MEQFVKIIEFENEIEARLVAEHLKEREIPHLLKSYGDSAYAGIFQTQHGWGHLEAPKRFEDEILTVYDDLIGR